jgi:hypothetical protein
MTKIRFSESGSESSAKKPKAENIQVVLIVRNLSLAKLVIVLSNPFE